MSKKGLGKLVLGAGIGASLALLFAPKKGSDLRNDIKKKINFVRNQQEVFHMEIKTDSNRLREIMFHLFVWFKISIYYF